MGNAAGTNRRLNPAGPWLAAVGIRLSNWFERWFPDAFAVALAAVVIVFAGCVLVSGAPLRTAQAFGDGFWDLVTFTVQVSLLIITGYVVATAPPVHAVIRRMAGVPQTPSSAIAFVAVFSMLSSLLSWTFSLIFSAFLAREVARRVRGVDYRAVGAAAYLGVGSVWALGLSSSAALIMANADSLPDSIERISGVIPLSQTIGLWQSLVMAAVLIGISAAAAYFSAPNAEDARTIEAMGVSDTATIPSVPRAAERPGDRLELSPLPTVIVCACGIAYLASEVAARGPAVLLDLNHYLFAFVMAGLLLHWRPRSFVHAVAGAAPTVASVIVQYPLYAGIVRMMTESGLADRLAQFFVAVSTFHTFPVLVGIYSALLGLFVPSAGGKWLIEAPYVLPAAQSLGVHIGWVVQTYNATEALANLIHPFWMLPLIGILGLKPRDIVGYSILQLVVHVPVVLLLVWALHYTF